MAPVKSVCLKAYIKKNDKPKADDFEVKVTDETFTLQDGQVLVKTLYLSLDPVLRYKMNSDASFTTPWVVGQPCDGVGVGLVLDSKYGGLAANDIVDSMAFPYRTQFVIDGTLLNKVI